MHAFSIEELTRDDIRKLTVILYSSAHHDSESVRRINDLIDSLPSYLHRSRLLNFVPAGLGIYPASAKTCALHKRLNGHVIRSILDLVKKELGERQEKLAANQVMLSQEQKHAIQTLREVNSMWMSESEYRAKFLVWPQQVWGYQHDGCEACILSRIGRDETVITNLRIALLSRTRTRSPVPPPRLTRFVDEFICCHGPRTLEIFMHSGDAAKALKKVRKELNAELKRYNSRATKKSRKSSLGSSQESSRKSSRKSSQKSSRKSSRKSKPDQHEQRDMNEAPQRHESMATVRLLPIRISQEPQVQPRPDSSALVDEIIDLYADLSPTRYATQEPVVPQPTHLPTQHWDNAQDDLSDQDAIIPQPLAPHRGKSHNAWAQEIEKQKQEMEDTCPSRNPPDLRQHPAFAPRRAYTTSVVSRTNNNHRPVRANEAWKGLHGWNSISNDLAPVASQYRDYPPSRWYGSISNSGSSRNNLTAKAIPRTNSSQHYPPTMIDDTTTATTTASTLPRSHTTKTSNDWAQEYRAVVRKDALSVPTAIPTPSSVYSRDWDDGETIRAAKSPGLESTAETTWSFLYNGE